MAKVEMNGFTVHNVAPCPKCDATNYARRDEVLGMVIMCCNECDYEVPGAIMMRGSVSVHTNPKAFREWTRSFFNHWNKGVAEETGSKVKHVRIYS